MEMECKNGGIRSVIIIYSIPHLKYFSIKQQSVLHLTSDGNTSTILQIERVIVLHITALLQGNNDWDVLHSI